MKKVKKLLYGQEARQALANGLNKVADAVKVTLGPRGRLVLISNPYRPSTMTKDGVSVAREIVLGDPFEQEGAKLCIEVASRCNIEVGDGPQPLYSKVLTPNGFVEMGSLKVGDEICGTDNTTQNIVGVFPKGTKQIYKVKLVDGREVECCEDHLWKVSNDKGVSKVLTVKQLVETNLVSIVGGNKRHHYFIPTSKVNFKHQSFKLDPYLVGLLLGDGTLSGTASFELSLGSNDEGIINQIPLPEGLYTKSTYVEDKHYYQVKIQGRSTEGKYIREYVDEIGLLGTKSSNKFIPKNYLYSDTNSRLKLLEGLIDTGGHVNRKGRIEYSTISKQLAKDVLELMRSLGKTATIYKYNRKEGKSVYQVTELEECKYGVAVGSIDATDTFTEMQCIKVSNEDSLYFTDNYVITHNTTSSTILAQALVSEGLKALAVGANPVAIKKGMDDAVEAVVDYLSDSKKDISSTEEVEFVATISGNDAEVGKIVADAFNTVGKSGTVMFEESRSAETLLSLVEGYQIDRGLFNEYFARDQAKLRTELENPLILFWGDRIVDMQEIGNFLNLILPKLGDKPLLLIADNFEDNALSTIYLNAIVKPVINCTLVRSPGIGDRKNHLMQDMAAFCGGTYFNPSFGRKIETVRFEELGTAERVSISMTDTIFVNGGADKEKLDTYISNLKTQISESESKYDIEKLNERIGKLQNSVALIKVGAKTDTQLTELKHRYEDAINATKAALEEGIVSGGGHALLLASQVLKSPTDPGEALGFTAVIKALTYPARTIATNAGFNGDLVVEKSLETGLGFNSKTGVYSDLIGDGVIDPVKVTRSALQYASAIAGMILMAETLVVEEPEEPKQSMF